MALTAEDSAPVSAWRCNERHGWTKVFFGALATAILALAGYLTFVLSAAHAAEERAARAEAAVDREHAGTVEFRQAIKADLDRISRQLENIQQHLRNGKAMGK